MATTRIFRWKGVVPMLLLAIVIAVAWVLYVDVVIDRSVEVVGADVVGAKVDVEEAALDEKAARVVLRGLQVANPDAPMTNLVEIPDIVADLNARALAEKKIVVESLILSNVRFGTARRTSGALENPGPHSGQITRQITRWVAGIPTPELNLEGLVGTVVNVDGITADSLRSLQQARALIGAADSTRSALETQIRAADPRPLADSARALLQALQQAQSQRLNAVQAARLANDARGMVTRISAARDQVSALQASVESGVRQLRGGVDGLEAARRADMAYARNLVQLPSIEPPDISMAIFGDMAKSRASSMMRYVQTAEAFVPPGLNPRRMRGPDRARASGTSFTFPREVEFPKFLLERGVASLAIGGQTIASGAYSAAVSGVTTEPAIYGRPIVFSASRRGTVGPRQLDVSGVINRLGAEPRDSVRALVGGVSLPAIPIPKANASLEFAGGTTMDISVARNGGSLQGSWHMVADTVRWRRAGGDSLLAAAANARLGSREWAEGLLWRSLASIPRVELTIRIAGSITSPDLTLVSNVGEVVAANLRQALGQEIARAERMVRERVDALINEQVTRARAAFGDVERQLASVTGNVQLLDQLKADLEEQIRRSSGGVRLPNLPGLPRP